MEELEVDSDISLSLGDLAYCCIVQESAQNDYKLFMKYLRWFWWSHVCWCKSRNGTPFSLSPSSHSRILFPSPRIELYSKGPESPSPTHPTTWTLLRNRFRNSTTSCHSPLLKMRISSSWTLGRSCSLTYRKDQNTIRPQSFVSS